MKETENQKALRLLQEETLPKVAMITTKKELVISPYHCIENGISNILIEHNKFGSQTIMKIRTDFANRHEIKSLRRLRKHELY